MSTTAATLDFSAGEIRRVLEIEQTAFSQPWTLADFQWLSHAEHSVNVGLWQDAELMGYAIGVVEGTTFHLASLAVDPDRRRLGWGSRLLQAALKRAADRGCTSCRLEVRQSNMAALGMYEKFGFAADGVRPRFYTNPVEDARLLRRTLSVEPEPQSMVDG